MTTTQKPKHKYVVTGVDQEVLIRTDDAFTAAKTFGTYVSDYCLTNKLPGDVLVRVKTVPAPVPILLASIAGKPIAGIAGMEWDEWERFKPQGTKVH